MEDERGPGLDFQFVFCVRQSSVGGCCVSFVFVYFIIKCVKCSPVPASFFPYLLTSLHRVFKIIRKSQVGKFGLESGLELNSAADWTSREIFEEP